MTARATLTLVPQCDQLQLLTEYEGSFDPENPAHIMAQAIGGQLAEWLEPQSVARDLSPEEIALVKAQVLAEHAGSA